MSQDNDNGLNKSFGYAADGKLVTDNLWVNQGLDLLESEGFKVEGGLEAEDGFKAGIGSDSLDEFFIVLVNEAIQEAVVIWYFGADDKDIKLFRGPKGSEEIPSSRPLSEYIEEKTGQHPDQRKSNRTFDL